MGWDAHVHDNCNIFERRETRELFLNTSKERDVLTSNRRFVSASRFQRTVTSAKDSGPDGRGQQYYCAAHWRRNSTESREQNPRTSRQIQEQSGLNVSRLAQAKWTGKGKR